MQKLRVLNVFTLLIRSMPMLFDLSPIPCHITTGVKSSSWEVGPDGAKIQFIFQIAKYI